MRVVIVIALILSAAGLTLSFIDKNLPAICGWLSALSYAGCWHVETKIKKQQK